MFEDLEIQQVGAAEVYALQQASASDSQSKSVGRTPLDGVQLPDDEEVRRRKWELQNELERIKRNRTPGSFEKKAGVARAFREVMERRRIDV